MKKLINITVKPMIWKILNIDPDKQLDFTDSCKYILDNRENVSKSLNENELSLIHINIRSIQVNF